MSQPIRGKKYLTAKEAAERLDVHPHTLKEWVKSKKVEKAEKVRQKLNLQLIFLVVSTIFWKKT